MKQFKAIVASAIISVALTGATPVFAVPAAAEPQHTSLLDKVPSNLIVKQTATLSDGRSVLVYYRKSGNEIEVYSDSNLKGYKVNDLLALQNTEFALASRVSGKLVYKCPVSKARAIVKRMVNLYL